MEAETNISIPKHWHLSNKGFADYYLNNKFKDEKHFCDIIEDNIKIVCEKIFNEKYVSHQREYIFYETRDKRKRMDFAIITDKSKIGVECKWTKKINLSVTDPVGQLMKYKMYSDCQNLGFNRWAIFHTHMNREWQNVINYYKLPFELFFVSHSHVLKYH